MILDRVIERNLLPDALVRIGIRRLLRRRLATERRGPAPERRSRRERLLETMRRGPIAVETAAANEQHYEVPARFFELVLGPWMKYSSGYWERPDATLADAELAMLGLTADRAGVRDGMEVLDLGCGWGAVTLYLADRFPGCRVTGVSNSAAQRDHILRTAAARGLGNVAVRTADINGFESGRRFDRIVSVEMFEHARNYELLLRKLSGMLAGDGRLFVHMFTHREFAYLFEPDGDADWLARRFFTGGIMPSEDLLAQFDADMTIERRWTVEGTHYRATALAWLSNMDRRRAEVLEVFAGAYGPERAMSWYASWRVFFMACAELWGYRGGREWTVSHYLLKGR